MAQTAAERRYSNTQGMLRWQRANPEKYADSQLRTRYGITLETYRQMVADQNGVCAICGDPPKAGKRRLSVDHDHETGAIRGLSCDHCNRGIGLLGETNLAAAATYLERHKVVA